MTASSAYQTLFSAGPSDLLPQLKALKNNVIGNTWKKVEHASDEALLEFLIKLLEVPTPDDRNSVGIVCETAVILGALGSAGALTLRPMLAQLVPEHLLALIRQLPPDHPASARTLPPLLRALRNILGATADAVWGHMWGVGTEQKVVGTGLVGDDVLRPARVRRRAASQLRADATTALGLIFEPQNRIALLQLISNYPNDTNILLPLYQLLARLIVLPSHRELFGTPSSEPFLIPVLLETVTDWWASGSRPNPRILEAALDLVAALVKGQPGIAQYVREWGGISDITDDSVSDMVSLLVQLLETGPPGVRIAVAGCLTSIIKAEKTPLARDRVALSLTNVNLLTTIIKLLRTEAIEERVKLCFVLAALVSDDERLQKAAADQACPSQLISMLVEVDADETRGELGHEAATRSREGALLALAALSFQYEPTRSKIADAVPPVLPLVCSALSHPSYGVRAAACQLARALSRTVAILRTSLVDSGVGEEVVETLRREVAHRRLENEEGAMEYKSDWDVTAEEELGSRAWTVEVAATATICNLVTDFSPLKTKLLSTGGIELLAELTSSPYEPLAENALWALKNVMYHASEELKTDVMNALGWETLRGFLASTTSPDLRSQALEILQNLVDDQPAAELRRTLDNLGTDYVLDTVMSVVSPSVGATAGVFWGPAVSGRSTAGGTASAGVGTVPVSAEDKLAIPGLYILSHIALGSERLRNAITTRTEILEALSAALNSRNDSIRIPALRTLRHLVESNSRSHRPRQAIVDLLQPYHLKPRVREIAEGAPGVSVRQSAVSLLEILERARS